MTLSELAQFVCDKIGQTDDDSLSICKSFLDKRHKMIWNSRLWRDSLSPISDTAHTGYRDVVFRNAPEVDRVVAVCSDDQLVMGPDELFSLWLTNPAAFATTGGTNGTFSVLRRTPMYRGNDFVQAGSTFGFTAQCTTIISSVTITITGRDGFGRSTPTATATLTNSSPSGFSYSDAASAFYEIYTASTSIGDWSSDQEAITLTDVDSSSLIGALRPGLTTHPTFPQIRIAEMPTSDYTVRAIGKLSCPRLTDDDDAPALLNIDNALIAYAEGDMLSRERQRGKAAIAFQEAQGHLAALIEEERQQSASCLRIAPVVGGFSSDWPTKSFF